MKNRAEFIFDDPWVSTLISHEDFRNWIMDLSKAEGIDDFEGFQKSLVVERDKKDPNRIDVQFDASNSDLYEVMAKQLNKMGYTIKVVRLPEGCFIPRRDGG